MIILTYIQKHIVQSIVLGMAIGFILGALFDTSTAQSSVLFLSIMMVYPMMVTLNYRSLLSKGSIKLQVMTQVINFILLPFLAYIFGILFFRDYLSFRIAILLIALLPTSGMTVSWTVMSKGNVKEAIRMIIIGLILGGLLTPLYLNLYIGETSNVSFMAILNQIIYIIFIPMILGFLTQMIFIKKYTKPIFDLHIKQIFPKFSTLAVVTLISVVVSLRADMLLNNPEVLLIIIGPILLGYIIMFFFSHYIGTLLFSIKDRVALVNGTAIRSLSLAMAIALTVFKDIGADIALIIAVAFIIQAQLAATYAKMMIKKQASTEF
ncbi:MAG: arsenic resistance protein [Bacillota bacterium]